MVIPSDQPLPDDADDMSDLSDSSSATVIYGSETFLSREKSKTFERLTSAKRCRGSKRVYRPLDVSTIASPLRHGVVVVIKPIDSSKDITRYNPIAVKEGLETLAPDGVLQVRPNYRLNLLAIDTRNADATERLLKISSIAGVTVQAYEPRPSNCGVGVIRGVAKELSDLEILSALRVRAPVKSARRLGKSSESVQIVFATETVPEHVVIGYTRYRVYDYVETPIQCKNCQRFGHVANMCRLPLRCPRCGGTHDRQSCAAENPKCPNCNKKHESTFVHCSVRRDEKAIFKIKARNNTDYKSAKYALLERRKTGHNGHGKKQVYTSAGLGFINNEEDFPALPVLRCESQQQQHPPTAALPVRDTAATVDSPSKDAATPASTAAPARPSDETPTPAVRTSKPARRTSLREQREPNDHRSSGGLRSVISAVVEAVRLFLAPLSSPVAVAILTLLDYGSPFLMQWL